jgi:hypothetical protein
MKPIFIDLDGTLLCSNKKISQRAKDAFEHARTRGYEPIICTGRDFHRARFFTDQVNCRYMIYVNGGCIFDFAKSEILHQNFLEPAAALQLFNILNHPLCNTLIVNGSTRYLVQNQSWSSELTSHPMDTQIETADADFFSRVGCTQIIAVCPDANILKALKARVYSEMPHIAAINQARYLTLNIEKPDYKLFIDFAKYGTNKGSGVATFCEMFGIPRQDTIVIGDDINDVEMFQIAGLGVAMGNAIPQIRELADVIIDDNNCEGVAKFLESLT